MLKRACLAGAVLSLAAGAVGVGCGDRTGLVVDDTYGAEDSGTLDGGRDALSDVRHDGLPMIDVAIRPDVDRTDCLDAGATLIYLITQEYVLYSFYPPTSDFRQIGKIACPSRGNASPFSMAVDRKGIASILFTDGNLFRVSTATAACQATTFVPNQSGFLTFGMGYASDTNGPSETLYIAGDNNGGGATGLASIDVNYVVHPLGQFVPKIQQSELTGTGSGDLYAFYNYNMSTDPDSFVGQVDKQSGRIVGETRMTGVSQGFGWAFAFWGGDFFLFTTPVMGRSVVTRFRPSDGTVMPLTSLNNVIVGAGVSTCAPQN